MKVVEIQKIFIIKDRNINDLTSLIELNRGVCSKKLGIKGCSSCAFHIPCFDSGSIIAPFATLLESTIL